ncbi:putative dsrm domain protein [Rhizoctonia solani 123E]|uniref:Putative dsrm domain protein n=1 Tax=Rhizoctonia solani 123E TaxID=1423351 RepID=A0A074S3C7_9AGAM|nr:putative dsrm domain protein [Rhizoctonia solani 123E]
MLAHSHSAPRSFLLFPLISMAAIFTRTYTPKRGSQYRDQLNIWCDRMGIAHIRFVTDPTSQRDTQDHPLFQAFPIFPNVIDQGINFAAQGWSQQEAYHASLSQIPWAQVPLRPDSVSYNFDYRQDGSVIATPCLIRYGDYIQLTNVPGFGTSRRSAEEDAAKELLCSGRYCFF